jgi:ArsR family transcriptional regulator
MLITTYYSVIGDEVTYRIGLLLSRYALSVKEIGDALGLPQPRISHKLAKLRKYGCVTFQRDGQRVIYRFIDPCRSILLKGDANWRRYNPEFSSRWKGDLERVRALLGEEIGERVIYPVVDASEAVATVLP